MRTKVVFLYLITSLICVVVAFPFYWLVNTSLQPLEAVYNFPPSFLPAFNPLKTYTQFILHNEVMRWILNSLIVACVATVVSALCGVLGAYSISRFKYKGRTVFVFLFLLTQMMPPAFLVIPVYFIFAQMRIVNTLFSLMIVNTVLTMPISVWFLKGFLDSIPRDLEESALIDGCGRTKALIRILLPLIAPGIAATATWSFIIAWNEYVFALTLVEPRRFWVASVGIGSFVGQFYTKWDEIMTASVIVTIPVVVMFMVFQKYFVGGLTAGSVKG